MNFTVNLKIDVTDKVLQAVKLLTGENSETPKVEKTTTPDKKEEKAPQKSAPKKEEPKKKEVTAAPKKAEKTTPKKEEESAPSKEDLRKIAVQAIQKDRPAVQEMLQKHFPGTEKITKIPEEGRAEAIELLNQIIAA